MLQLTWSRRTLRFNFPARTSRGALTEHVAYYLHLTDPRQPGRRGLGEAAPLAGLSPDFDSDFEAQVMRLCADFNRRGLSELLPAQVGELVGVEWPALRFGVETAAFSWQNAREHLIYDNAFSRGEAGIAINGLVWMGDAAFMREQIRKKLTEGYSCLKLKIGGLDFATELRLLAEIRAVAGPSELTLRVDANGAFSAAEALPRLEQLAAFSLHSIEQPIAAGQWSQMAALCRASPVPIALDEELIGITAPDQQVALLEQLKPAYIILKPTLIGGLQAAHAWLTTAEQHSVRWWLTSALESNVALNAISQFAGSYARPDLPQGLGTGQLYHNNVEAPLHIRRGALYYEPQGSWDTFG
ncbi:o-succinylbenzoate synthase [Hymenobacter fastidiosus]|uniref:O-succinylbenzoate synthase n=1 Tax=Hymenobacter fastidiosus TaxID=486264 RepID=A0ABP7SKQ3_9BACT